VSATPTTSGRVNTSSSVDLEGFVLELSDGSAVLIPGSVDTVVPSGGFFVVSGAPLADVGPTPTRGFAHANPDFEIAKRGPETFETIELKRAVTERPSPLVYDRVSFNTAFRSGTSRQIVWSLADAMLPAEKNNDTGFWCDAGTAPLGGRDGGTPGRPSETCHRPGEQDCPDPTQIALDSYIFGDLEDPRVSWNSVNKCSNQTEFAALGPDLTYRVEVAQQTTVELRYDPVPNIAGDGSSEPWQGIVYWREGACPTSPSPPQPESLCLEPTDVPDTTTLTLEPGVVYYFTVDGITRSATGMAESGQYTFGLFNL